MNHGGRPALHQRPGLQYAPREAVRGLWGYWQTSVPYVHAFGIGRGGADVKRPDPHAQRDLGSPHHTVRFDAELRATTPAAIGHRPAIRGHRHTGAVTDRASHARGPAPCYEPGLGQFFVLEAAQNTGKCFSRHFGVGIDGGIDIRFNHRHRRRLLPVARCRWLDAG